MRVTAYSIRNMKEILRDPMNLIFGIGFPLVLLVLLSAIQANIPVSLFEIESLTPGIAVFGLSFMTLFSASLIAKDRGSAFLQRLYTTPMTPADYISGYMLPMLPISVAQTVVCYLAAVALGLRVSVNIIIAVVLNIPSAVLYIGLGLLFGSILNDKQVGGVCGALLTNLSAWLSGTWFDLKLVGGAFEKIADILPFVHSVELGRAAITGNYGGIMPHILWVSAYAVIVFALAVIMFLRQMRKQ